MIVFFVMNFIKKIFKITVSRKYGWNLIYVSFVCHLTTLPLWHVYSFAYDMYNWRDGIRYSYMSFCVKSASISMVDFSVDMLRRNNIFGKTFQVELKFICAEFQIFSALSKHDITVLVIIFHGNRSLTSYMMHLHFCLLFLGTLGYLRPSTIVQWNLSITTT